MTAASELLIDFATLREKAIDYAQDASRKIWTDYNVHDPGVTLLEQTCFALTQLAYQNAHPTRDMLTDVRGYLPARRMALFSPRDVLRTGPVTRTDLELWLSHVAGVASAALSPARDKPKGIYDLMIVRSDEHVPDLKARVRNVFARLRPLGIDLSDVLIANRAKVILTGDVEIAQNVSPELAAAQVYYGFSRILVGDTLGKSRANDAKRADLFEAPERIMQPIERRETTGLDLSKYVASMQSLPGLQDLGHLDYRYLDQSGLMSAESDGPLYLQSAMPRAAEEIELKLTLAGSEVALDPDRLREEITRIHADRRAQAEHHLDLEDFNVMGPGQRREYELGPVDALLPGLYAAASARSDDASMTAFRRAIDETLQDMSDRLSSLPIVFGSGSAKAPRRNVQQRLDQLAMSSPKWPEALVPPDLHDQEIAVLDYLLALQGVEMPMTRHTGLASYRSTSMRHAAERTVRRAYLYALPKLGGRRGTAPTQDDAGGFLTELGLLCDLTVDTGARATRALKVADLSLSDEAKLAKRRTDEAQGPDVITDNPFDMLVPDVGSAHSLESDMLKGYSGFIKDGKLDEVTFARLSKADTFLCLPDGEGWAPCIDLGDGDVRRLSVSDNPELDLAGAHRTVQQLRETWRRLHRESEVAFLVEHIKLDPQDDSAAQRADLILPRWTLRCGKRTYQTFVEQQVERLAPAHMHIRVQWLGWRRMGELENKLETLTDQTRAGLREWLDSMWRSSS